VNIIYSIYSILDNLRPKSKSKMSQSDYLKYKRVSTELKINDQPRVFPTQEYIDYKQYSMENATKNTKITYNQLIPPNRKIIFNMEKKTSSCPTFIICKSTNTRTNRVPMSQVYFTPRPVPTYVKQPSTAKTACNCMLNSVNNERNICKCKTSA
jgi:hypothetical protein